MIHESVYELRQDLKGAAGIDENGRVELLDAEKLRGDVIDTLVRDAVFGTFPREDVQPLANLGTGPVDGRVPGEHSRILHCQGGGCKWSNRTVPAMNMRFSTYEAGRAAFRAAQRTQTGAFIFEIARSEMGYTFQEPAEFSAVLIAGAIKEGYRGPIFIQGDHFQVDGKKYK